MKREMVDHPSHYQGNGLEVIDVIEAFDLGFCLGNVVKYILRAGKKDARLQELKKAAWYLKREIDNEEKAQGDKERVCGPVPLHAEWGMALTGRAVR